MIILKSLIVILFLTHTSLLTNGQKYEPTWESFAQKDAAPQWFEDAVLGIYFHWGIYSVPGNSCWTGMNMYKKSGTEWEHVPEGYENTYHYIKETYGEPGIEFGYKDFIPMFTAEKWDPDRWQNCLKKPGRMGGYYF
jgi:alpha-L-fucosidase